MKKIITILAVIILSNSLLYSQSGLGVKAGLNFNSINDISESVDESWGNKTGYHLGLSYQARVPFIGIGFQPELLFVRQGAKSNTSNESFYLDYITVPVNIQYGLDLLLFRPFVMVGPYISYAIGKGHMLSGAKWDDINRFDYGYSFGAGIDIWKFQVAGKYNRGLGKLQSAKSDPISGNKLKNAKMEGFMLSLTVML